MVMLKPLKGLPLISLIAYFQGLCSERGALKKPTPLARGLLCLTRRRRNTVIMTGKRRNVRLSALLCGVVAGPARLWGQLFRGERGGTAGTRPRREQARGAFPPRTSCLLVEECLAQDAFSGGEMKAWGPGRNSGVRLPQKRSRAPPDPWSEV